MTRKQNLDSELGAVLGRRMDVEVSSPVTKHTL